MVTNCPGCIVSWKIRNINMKIITWRSILTNVPCTKLSTAEAFDLLQFKPKYFICVFVQPFYFLRW